MYMNKNTVLSVFNKIEALGINEEVKIHEIKENIDLISGFLDEYEKNYEYNRWKRYAIIYVVR